MVQKGRTATKRELNNLATRQRILDAASECTAAYGFSGSTVKNIAAAAGLSPSHVLYYFTSREALMLEALRFSEAGRNQMIRDAAEASDPRLRLSAAIETSMPSSVNDRQWLMWIGALDLAARDEQMQVLVRQLDVEHRRMLALILAQTQAAWGVDPLRNDNGLTLDLLVAGLDGIATGMLSGTISFDRKVRLTECLIENAINGGRAPARFVGQQSSAASEHLAFALADSGPNEEVNN